MSAGEGDKCGYPVPLAYQLLYVVLEIRRRIVPELVRNPHVIRTVRLGFITEVMNAPQRNEFVKLVQLLPVPILLEKASDDRLVASMDMLSSLSPLPPPAILRTT
jgi:hypothetical protein